MPQIEVTFDIDANGILKGERQGDDAEIVDVQDNEAEIPVEKLDEVLDEEIKELVKEA
jgi:molecular chaperone DnaK (HSP70)